MKKIVLLALFLISGICSYAQTYNAEQIKKDNYTIKGNALHQLMTDTTHIATKHYVDSVSGGSTFDSTGLSNRINLKVDSVKRHPGTDSVFYYTNGTEHFGFIDSVSSSAISAAAWSLTGNAATNPSTNFLGTTDNQPLRIRTNDSLWMELGVTGILGLRHGIDSVCNACYTDVPKWDSKNIVIGMGAMQASSPYAPDSLKNYLNVFIGTNTGKSAKAVYGAVGIGNYVMEDDTGKIHFAGGFYPPIQSFENVGLGNYALRHTNGGNENSAGGTGAMEFNTTGSRNSAWGQAALNQNTVGSDNNAFGRNALGLTVNGAQNVAMGNSAAGGNVNGSTIVAIGYLAMGTCGSTPENGIAIGAYSFISSSGQKNIGLGFASGLSNSSGASNIFIGHYAGSKCATLSNRLIIDHFDGGRANVNGDTTLAIIVAKIGQTSVADQSLKVDGIFGVNDGNQGAGKFFICNDANGYGQWSTVAIDTTAKDAVTQNTVQGHIRKDQTGTTYTVTNSLVTLGSRITLTLGTTGVTAGNQISVLAQTGSFVITFETSGVAAAPNKDTDIYWSIGN